MEKWSLSLERASDFRDFSTPRPRISQWKGKQFKNNAMSLAFFHVVFFIRMSRKAALHIQMFLVKGIRFSTGGYFGGYETKTVLLFPCFSLTLYNRAIQYFWNRRCLDVFVLIFLLAALYIFPSLHNFQLGYPLHKFFYVSMWLNQVYLQLRLKKEIQFCVYNIS